MLLFFINDDLEAENEDEDRHLDDLDDLVLYQGILRNMHHRAKKIDFQQPRELQPRIIIIINYCIASPSTANEGPGFGELLRK